MLLAKNTIRTWEEGPAFKFKAGTFMKFHGRYEFNAKRLLQGEQSNHKYNLIAISKIPLNHHRHTFSPAFEIHLDQDSN